MPFVGEGGEDEAYYDGYYDENGEWVVNGEWNSSGIPEGHVHDDKGRLIDEKKKALLFDGPEDPVIFKNEFQKQRLSSLADAAAASKVAWPDIKEIVHLKRLDLFESTIPPRCGQGTIDINTSRRIRITPNWIPTSTMFLLDIDSSITKELNIDAAGPPRRHRFQLKGKSNSRDLTTWVPKEVCRVFIGSDRIQGASDVFVDYQDGPDRYFIAKTEAPDLGLRRLYRFGAYTATQYYILEKRVVHDCLASEGGVGFTYTIEQGPLLYSRKGSKLIGSFFGFDKRLAGTNKYSIYYRDDPFPRMLIALGPISYAERWQLVSEFYAWDVAIPGTVGYDLHHCCRSIHSTESSIPRHRLTMADALQPWEQRMKIYVFPAAAEDVSCTLESVGLSLLPSLNTDGIYGR